MDDTQKRKIAADCWKRGNDAVSKEDFKYAMEMYRQSVNLCPDNVLYRQSLRACEQKFYKDNKTGKGGMFVKSTVAKMRMQTKTARMRSKWDELDKLAEDGLALNPWDAHFNADAGEACHQRGFLDAAAMLFQQARQADPNNVDYIRALAEIQEQRGNNVEASKLWDRVYRLNPLDGEARRRSQDNITTDTTKKGGYEEADSTRQVTAKSAYDQGEDRSRAGAAGRDKDELSEQEQLERTIRKDPESVDARLKYAEFLRKQKDWEHAIPAYQAALDASGGDHNIRERLEDCEIDVLRHNLDLGRQRAEEQPDPKAKARLDAAERELVLREMEILRARIERYPNDSRLKFELGKRYMRIPKFQEAIPLLQQCVNDTRIQSKVLLLLGKCFLGVKNNGIAKRQLTRATEVINPIDEPEEFCEAHYWLGRLAEGDNDRAAAEKHYSEILAIDYGYKDVQKRIEALE